MYKQLTEHSVLKGFYKHPTLEGLFIHSGGYGLDESTNKIITVSPNKNGYPYLLYREKAMMFHRLLGEVFLTEPTDVPKDRLIINHKNGVKSDFRLENLEWTTYRGNLLHAYKTGLNPKAKTILAKDVETSEVIKFYSLNECAAYFNVNPSYIYSYLKPEVKGVVRFDRFILIREGDTWPEGFYHSKTGKPEDYIFVDKKTNKHILFSGYRTLAQHLGLPMSTVIKRIHDAIAKNKLFENELHIYGRLKDFLDNVPPDIERVGWTDPNPVNKRSEKFVRTPTRMKVENLETGVSQEFASMVEVATYFNTNKHNIQAAMSKKNGVYKGKYQLTYLKGPAH